MRLALCAVCVFLGAVVFAVPNMTRRELLFAVPIPPGFRYSAAGRRALWTFRALLLAAVVVGIGVLLLSPDSVLNISAAIVPIAIPLAGGIGFWWQHRRLAGAAVQFATPRETELTSVPEKLPRFTWLLAGPFAILAMAAEVLYYHWTSIPARFAMHFDALGQPNLWADRTTRGVYGPLLFGTELCTWFLVMALAGWYGSRRSHSRTIMLGGMIAIEYFVGLLFALIALQPLLHMPAWVILLLPMTILIPLIIVMANKMSEPEDPMDSTPNECWKAGIFYYNPNDAALFVEKRDGIGFAFNFANRLSWLLLFGMALVLASAPFVVG